MATRHPLYSLDVPPKVVTFLLVPLKNHQGAPSQKKVVSSTSMRANSRVHERCFLSNGLLPKKGPSRSLLAVSPAAAGAQRKGSLKRVAPLALLAPTKAQLVGTWPRTTTKSLGRPTVVSDPVDSLWQVRKGEEEEGPVLTLQLADHGPHDLRLTEKSFRISTRVRAFGSEGTDVRGPEACLQIEKWNRESVCLLETSFFWLLSRETERKNRASFSGGR